MNKQMRVMSRKSISAVLSLFVCLNPVLASTPQAALPSPSFISVIDPSVGSVSLTHQGESDLPVIYLIQDAHTNESAQINISRMLEMILQKTSANYVFMEAGSGDESVRFLRNEENLQELTRTGYEFLRKGKLQGVEYQNLTGPYPFTIWGVEDNGLYEEALETYKLVITHRHQALEEITRMKNALTSLENRLFSSTVSELNHSIQSYKSGEAGFDGHFDLALKLMKRLGIDSGDYPQFAEILKLKASEGNINFDDVNQEFVEFISDLKIDSGSTGVNLKYKNSDADYWANQMERSGLADRYPELNRYFKYVQSIRQIRLRGTLDELDLIDSRLIERLASDIEFRVIALQRKTDQMEKLINLQADAELYREASGLPEMLNPELLKASINRMLVNYNFFPEKLMYEDSKLSEALLQAMNFYHLTLRRDSRMLQNMFRKIRTENLNEAVLIAGGFHTENLVKQIKRAGCSIVLMEPVIAHETDMNRYERLLFDRGEGADSSVSGTAETGLRASYLMRKRLLNHPQDYQAFIKIVRPDLVGRIADLSGNKNGSQVLTASQPFMNSLAGARLGAEADSQRVIEIELLLDNWEVSRVSEEEQIETLLALLYGGSTMLPSGDLSVQSNPKYSGRSNYSEGLLQILSRAEFSGNAPLRTDARRIIRKIESGLEHLGIPKILTQKDGSKFNLHEALSVDRYYFNPFLISFTGLPDYARGEDEGRFQKALQTLELKGSKRKRAEEIFLTYLDVYQPKIKSGGNDVYALRVKHNKLLGTPKGGVRYVTAFALLHDDVFKERFDRLNSLGVTKEGMRYFVRRWVKQETLPLAVGMTIKTAAVNAGDKESWWTEVFRMIFGTKATHNMLGGAKGSILLADVTETEDGISLKDIFERSPEGLLKWYEVTRLYAADLYLNGKIGPDIDVPAPDVGVPPGAMDVATDEVLKIELESLKASGTLDAWPASLNEIRSRLFELLNESFSSTPNQTEILKYFSSLAIDLEDGNLTLDEEGQKALQPLIELRSVFTAKSVDPEYLSGSAYRIEATGYGVVHVLDQVVRMSVDELKVKFKKLYPSETKLLSVERQPLQHLTAKVMGFGNVGLEAVRELIARGVRVQMVSEGPNGIIRKESGFTVQDLQRLSELRRRHPNEPYFKLINNEADSDIKIQGAQVVNGDDPEGSFFNTHANIFVLAAKENTITTRNVAKVKADIYIEGANGAISYAAYDILEKRGSIVIPDSLANAGGVVVSYFEMLQNRVNKRWPARKVVARLESYLNKAIAEINEYRTRYNTDWRTAIDIRVIEMLTNADNGARLAADSGSAENLIQGVRTLRTLIEKFIEHASDSEAILPERALERLNQAEPELKTGFKNIPDALLKAQNVLNQANSEFEVYHAPEITAEIRVFAAQVNDIVNYAESIRTAEVISGMIDQIRSGTDEVVLSESDSQIQNDIVRLSFVSKQFRLFLSHLKKNDESLLWTEAVQRVALGYALRIRRLAHDLYLSIDESGLLWQEEQTVLALLSDELNHFQSAAIFKSKLSKTGVDRLNRILETNQFLEQFADFSISQILNFRISEPQDKRIQDEPSGYYFSDNGLDTPAFIISAERTVNLSHLFRDAARYLADQDIAFVMSLTGEGGLAAEEISRQWNVSYERWLIKSGSDGARLSELDEAQNDSAEIHRYLSEIIDRVKDAHRSGDYVSSMNYLRDAVSRLNTANYSEILRNTITTGGGLMSIYDFNNMANAMYAYLESDAAAQEPEYDLMISKNFRRIELFLGALERFSSIENRPLEITIEGHSDLELYAPKDRFVYLPFAGSDELLEALELYAGSSEKNIYRLLADLWSVIDRFQLDGQIFGDEDVESLLPAVIADDYSIGTAADPTLPFKTEAADEDLYDYLQEEPVLLKDVINEWVDLVSGFQFDKGSVLYPLLNENVLSDGSGDLMVAAPVSGKEAYALDTHSGRIFVLNLASEAPTAAVRVIQSSALILHTDGTISLFKQAGNQFLRKNAIPATDTVDPLRSLEVRGSEFLVPIVDSPVSYAQISPGGQITYHDDVGARLAGSDNFSGIYMNELSPELADDLARFVRSLSSEALNPAERIFSLQTESGQILRLIVRAEKDPSGRAGKSVRVIDESGREREVISPEQILSTAFDDSGADGYTDDLRLMQQIQSEVQSELTAVPDRDANPIRKKVIGFDLSVLEGKGLSDQAVYEAILPLLAAEFRMRYLRSSGRIVFYLSGPNRWVAHLTDLADQPAAYLFHDGNSLPREFTSEDVRRSDLIRPDADTQKYRGITIPVIAPEQLEDQVSLFPVTAILDFAESAADLLNADREIDAEKFIALKKAYEVFIGRSIAPDIFRDLLTGNADPFTMNLYGIPSLKRVSIDRFIKVFSITARMSAQSA